jgi:hypothetical protein
MHVMSQSPGHVKFDVISYLEAVEGQSVAKQIV